MCALTTSGSVFSLYSHRSVVGGMVVGLMSSGCAAVETGDDSDGSPGESAVDSQEPGDRVWGPSDLMVDYHGVVEGDLVWETNKALDCNLDATLGDYAPLYEVAGQDVIGPGWRGLACDQQPAWQLLGATRLGEKIGSMIVIGRRETQASLWIGESAFGTPCGRMDSDDSRDACLAEHQSLLTQARAKRDEPWMSFDDFVAVIVTDAEGVHTWTEEHLWRELGPIEGPDALVLRATFPALYNSPCEAQQHLGVKKTANGWAYLRFARTSNCHPDSSGVERWETVDGKAERVGCFVLDVDPYSCD